MREEQLSVLSGGRSRFKVWLLVALVLSPIVIGTLSVTTAGNTVPDSRLGSTSQVTGLTHLRPYVCSVVAVTTLVTGTGNNLNGTNGSDLILARSTTRNINGRNGDDCIVGGGSQRNINGGGGNDVCIGPSSATFTNCETIVRR